MMAILTIYPFYERSEEMIFNKLNRSYFNLSSHLISYFITSTIISSYFIFSSHISHHLISSLELVPPPILFDKILIRPLKNEINYDQIMRSISYSSSSRLPPSHLLPIIEKFQQMIEYEMRSNGISNLSKKVKSINEPKNLL